MRTPHAASAPAGIAVLCILTLVVTACGSGPSARVWAASVCEALAPWRTEISNLTRNTQQQMTAETTPAQAKENLVRLMGGAEQASETARRAVQDAGVPDVENGQTVSREFLASLTGMRDAYRRARKSIEGLDTTEADGFYAGVRTAVNALNRDYDASALDTSKLDSVELKRAFDEVPECR